MNKTKRLFNFSAGPAVLPEPVLEEVRRNLIALPDVGISVLELSHRSKTVVGILDGAERNIRELAGIPDDYHVLFLQGGATQQFAMVPMNLLPEGGNADYLISGVWAKKAADEAKLFGSVTVAATTEAEQFTRLPEAAEVNVSKEAAYVHLTSNNTIVGTQWKSMPETGTLPLVVDASSDIFSRPIDLARDGVGLLYAGAQKNLGVAGVTVVLIRDDLLQRVAFLDRTVPTMLRYSTYAKSKSLHNTPPVFAIYTVGLVTEWLLSSGGLEEIARCNERKAGKLYTAIDGTGFYRGTAETHSRSLMNITMRLPTEELEAKFVKDAANVGLVGLQGHRSVGGLRFSIYNAFPEFGVDKLIDFMDEFEKANG